MSSGPFVDRAEAEAKTKELERYLFEDGLAGALLEFLRTLNSMPADKRPSDPMESLLKGKDEGGMQNDADIRDQHIK
ncbi:hypothetical protein Y032_0203g1828 [Ancylostoma ceylanicum]|uniref:Uncharacterized protein n=1 Tax=Ancylostoma ceylanicum TaxID=53326 RepID=A0A016SMR9_9BILA|nr:hypothetical protein Y032_0203g1828 [Ancylostoma ceylanicum]